MKTNIKIISYSSLTKREKADLDYKRKILKLAKEHEKAGELEKVDRYYMPKDDVVCTFFMSKKLFICHAHENIFGVYSPTCLHVDILYNNLICDIISLSFNYRK